MGNARDVAVVLSGGSINAALMELGFLRRLEDSPLWPRVGWIFGTSAGALTGTMAALDRLDVLERFLVELRPEDAFRPNRLWRLPLLGTHDYALPATIHERVGNLTQLAEELSKADRELVVCATDVSYPSGARSADDYELVYSSRSAPPNELAQAILASAAMSPLVLPLRIGSRIATDGAWTRSFPLGHAYDRPEVEQIVAFRYVARHVSTDPTSIVRLRKRLERFRRVPPVRALLEELHEAEQRERRGEPGHLMDLVGRLMRIAILRTSALEERIADEKDASIAELERLRTDVDALLARALGDREARERLRGAVRERFAAAEFPFRHDRLVPRITVRASTGAVSLEPRFRHQQPWTEEAKRALIERGYRLTDRQLARHGFAAEAAATAA